MGAWIAAKLVADAGFPFELGAARRRARCDPGRRARRSAVAAHAGREPRGRDARPRVGDRVADPEPPGAQRGASSGSRSARRTVFGVSFDRGCVPGAVRAVRVPGVSACSRSLVANLRRSRAGRRLIAVRTNERAAAALGIGVFGAKLYAFGLSAGIAAVGGVLIVFQRPDGGLLPDVLDLPVDLRGRVRGDRRHRLRRRRAHRCRRRPGQPRHHVVGQPPRTTTRRCRSRSASCSSSCSSRFRTGWRAARAEPDHRARVDADAATGRRPRWATPRSRASRR